MAYHVVHINPDTTSSIYSLFNTGAVNTTSLLIIDEPTIEELEDAITLLGAGNNDLIYLLNNGYSTGLSAQQFVDLNTYFNSLFVIDTTDKIDIFYLTNFMDNCMNRVPLSNKTTNSISNFTSSFTVAATGAGCIVATKSKWAKILNLAKNQDESKLSAKITALNINEKIIAGTMQPLLVHPDLTEITDALDALKTQYCRIEKNFGRSVPNTENLSLFWFISGVTVVVFVAWVMSYYVPRNRSILTNKY